MNETKELTITLKLILTIPAIFVGIVSAFLHLFKPLYDLWFIKADEEIIGTTIEKTETKHDFH